jgi:hypothetical protein
VWYEKGQRRECEAATEDRLAARLEKVNERLATGAPSLERPDADLIGFYLSPGVCGCSGSRPASTHNQRWRCERFGHRRGPARTR